MRKKEILPIGTWGFINGNRLIDEKSWKRNFPQGIFGKIVEHEVNRNILYKGTYYIVRVYVGSARRKNGCWKHQRVHPKYFQKW
jgi:hypothetical protein